MTGSDAGVDDRGESVGTVRVRAYRPVAVWPLPRSATMADR